MSAAERKALVSRLIEELWIKGNLDFAEECFTTDFVGHDPSSPEQIRGPEGFKARVAAVRVALPNCHMRIEGQVAEGDKVVTRYVITGTHEGELAGIPPTGKRVEVAGMGIVYFRGSKICESWEYYDVLGLMQQLGAVPYPEEQSVQGQDIDGLARPHLPVLVPLSERVEGVFCQLSLDQILGSESYVWPSLFRRD